MLKTRISILMFIPILLGAIIFLFTHITEANSIPVMSKNLSLDSTANWGYYDGPDAPEGSYFGWLYSGDESLEGNIPLGTILTPGKYNVFIKVIDYSKMGILEISLGGVKSTIAPNNRDLNRYWTGPVTFDTVSDVNSITVTLLKTVPVVETQKYGLIGLYITDNLVEDIVPYGYDKLMSYDYPTQMDDSPAVKYNLIENSSFETGIGRGWGMLAEGYFRDYTLNSLWDNTVSHSGKASVKVPFKAEFISKTYRVKENKLYTLSAWAKSSGTSTLYMEIYNVAPNPEGSQEVQKLSTLLYLDTNWQRISVEGYLLDYPSNEYQITFIPGRAQPYVWIDDIQLEEGGLSDYAPTRPIEIGLVSDHVSNIFFEDESVSMKLLAYNNSDQGLSKTVNYEIYDSANAKVKEGSVNINVSSKTTLENNLNLSTGKRGIFRIVLWIDNMDRTEEEVVYSVLPRPQNTGLDEGSFIGIHANPADYQLEALQKLGIKWARTLSTMQTFRWNEIEPNEGQFVWHDEDIDKVIANGFTILGTLGTNDYWPGWADNGGLPNLDKWETFVSQMVTHYKDKVKFWEVWNEPLYTFSSSFYAEMLKRAANAIYAADPNAKIVGMGGVYEYDWILDVIGHIGSDWASYMDVISTHLYPPGADPVNPSSGAKAVKFKELIIDPYNMPVWNTETGAWDEGFYKGSNSNFVNYGAVSLYPYLDGERYYRGSSSEITRVAVNFLHSIGNGFTGYHYYDSRLFATPKYMRNHPTIMEYDDTIRSKGVAFAILAYFFDHAKGLGNISNDPNTTAYLFDKNGTPLVAIWSSEYTQKSINLSITNFIVYDGMGNPIVTSGNSISYGVKPVYVAGQGISVDAFKAAFQAGLVSNLGDVEPPNLSISVAPRGVPKYNNLYLRWIAIDNISIPNQISPDAILYSSKLEGIDNSWSAWTPNTILEYSNLPAGTYTFNVKAKDESGNISPVVSRQILIISGPPINLRVVN